MARSYFSDEECRAAGFSAPMIETLRKIADFVALVQQADQTDTDLTSTLALLISTEARVDDLEDFESQGPYVIQDVGSAWTSPSAPQDRSALPNYAAGTISAAYTQAEVQAIADQLQAVTRALSGVIKDLKDNGALT